MTSGARSVDDLMRDVAIGSLATCGAACVALLLLYLYRKAVS